LDPIELHEAVIGTGKALPATKAPLTLTRFVPGGLCGGIFIDEQFEHLCKQRLGRNWNGLSQTGIKSIMKNEWEYTYKPLYTGRDFDREFPVGIPAEALRGTDRNDLKRKPHIKDGRIHFSKYVESITLPLIPMLSLLIEDSGTQLGYPKSFHGRILEY
jgi:hypothetical protein